MTINNTQNYHSNPSGFSIRDGFVILLGTLLMLVFTGVESEAADGSWMYRRSYFSHAPEPHGEIHYPQPESRSAYRKAYHGVNPGFAVTGGYRVNRVQLRSGNSVDTTVQYEGWNMMYGPRYKP
ncbi:hypothetical protein Pla110_33870 [Polystyrenella longa]|uniref:Uncharacterized protein n=2 Tax=Polystyrenella longa TaxID=2528007 RepID=A0A518CQZ7_9PLAN|nr:hypothetical protein Pla110_33870 [Polystyrenella longa]